MRASDFLIKVYRNPPSECEIPSHKRLIQAGFIYQTASGIYSFLPMGLKVLAKISTVIRHFHDAYGCSEMLMPTMQSADIWKRSGRLNDYGPEMLKVQDRHEKTLIYGPTNEEQVTIIANDLINSYRDLPKITYQIQWKFRDEIRPRYGLLRGREFLMKDAYSFDISPEAARKSYGKMLMIYHQIFSYLGLKVLFTRADSGAIGGDLSHEVHILSEIGESDLYFQPEAMNLSSEMSPEEFLSEVDRLYSCTSEKHDPNHNLSKTGNIQHSKGIEVGHLFYFGTKYSQPLEAQFTSVSNEKLPFEMGSYGIGVSRLMAAMLENNDNANWPMAIAPFEIVIIYVNDKEAQALELYHSLQEIDMDVLLENRSGLTLIEKIKDFEVIGVPIKAILGNKSEKIELNHNGVIQYLDAKEIINYLGEMD